MGSGDNWLANLVDLIRLAVCLRPSLRLPRISVLFDYSLYTRCRNISTCLPLGPSNSREKYEEVFDSKLALARGNEAIKPFAQQTISDQQNTSPELKQLIESGQVKATLGATTSSAHHDAR